MLPNYSQETMEAATAKKAKATKPKKAKPPCKYGPRDADGYCPKKPKKFSSSQFGKRILEKTAGNVAGNVAAAGVEIAFNPELRQAVKQAIAGKVAAAGAKIAGFPGAIAALPGAQLAAVAAAGTAAFFGTQYLRKLWDDVQTAKLISKKERDNRARANWLAAMEKLREEQGRDLTQDERLMLYNLFYEEKKTS